MFVPKVGFAESNFLGITPFAAIVAVAGVKALYSKTKGPVFYTLAFLWTGTFSLIPVLGQMNRNDFIEDIHGFPLMAVYVPTGHYRMELNYTLAPTSGTALSKKGNEGSCLLFFTVDREAATVDYEIDDCTHREIFPEEVAGDMRTGGKSDWLDKQWGQTMVVAKGRGVPLLEDE